MGEAHAEPARRRSASRAACARWSAPPTSRPGARRSCTGSSSSSPPPSATPPRGSSPTPSKNGIYAYGSLPEVDDLFVRQAREVGPQEARGAGAPDPEDHHRPGHARADLRAGLHLGRGAAGGGERRQPHPRLRVLGAVRGPQAQAVPSYSLGIDIGGTFTDIVVYDHDARTAAAAARCSPPTTTPPGRWPPAWRRCSRERRARRRRDFTRVVHATTLFTNALIERKGARHRAPHHRRLRRHARDRARAEVRALRPRTSPSRSRWCRATCGSRSPSACAPTARVAPHARRARRSRRRRAGWSTAGVDVDRRRVPARLRQPAPRGGGGAAHRASAIPTIAVTTSHEVAPEIREYERASTTVANAYIKPLAQQLPRR